MSIDLDQSNSCVVKIRTTWREFLSWMRIPHSIHPLEPIAPEYSEFVRINPNSRIRCIHINPSCLHISNHYAAEIQKIREQNNRINNLEEYWFTRSIKPSRNGVCNCSFRKSLRLSVASSEKIHVIDKPPPLRKNSYPSKTTIKYYNINKFVEHLIKDAVLDAFQEYYIMQLAKSKSLGIVNLAFSCKPENVTFGSVHEESNDELYLSNEETSFQRCNHKTMKWKKPLIMLLHGIGATADIWWKVIESLVSEGYEIVAPDMLGHGFSSAPNKENDYMFDKLLMNMLSIFDHYLDLHENRKCILIGHSYGCSLATAMYHHRLGSISHLILISGGGPTPLAPPATFNDHFIHTKCIQALIQPLIFCGANRSLFYSSRGKFFDVYEESSGIPEHILEFVKMGQSWPEGDAASHRRIFIPTLLIHGLQDSHVTLVQECEMERTIPRSFLELIPNAGHMPMLETPENLIHMILCFLDCWL